MTEDEINLKKARKLGFLVILISMFLILISCICLNFLEETTSLKIIKMKRYSEEMFEREMKNQEDKIEMYLILPNNYGREEIDDYIEDLGNKFKYKLISIEFKYNHVIYKFRKSY